MLLLHFKELKYRFFYIIFSWTLIFSLNMYYDLEVLYLWIKPLLLNIDQSYLIFTNLSEVFLAELNLNFRLSFFLILPLIGFHSYLFFISGLYLNEKKLLSLISIKGPIIFLLLLFLIHKFILPLIWKFFITFSNNLNMNNNLFQLHFEAKFVEYLNLHYLILLYLSIILILPIYISSIILYQNNKQENLFKIIQNLIYYRKFIIITFLLISALISPPDIFSQIILVIPFQISYEFIIFILYYYYNYNKYNNNM